MNDVDSPIRSTPFDEELRRRFGADAPSGADPDAVLDAMRPQLQRAAQPPTGVVRERARRRCGRSWSCCSSCSAAEAEAPDRVRVPPATNGPVSTCRTTTTTAPRRRRRDTRLRAPRTTPDSRFRRPRPRPAPPTAPATVPTATPSDYFTDFSSAGGSITVHVTGDQVKLSKTAAAPGYTPEVHDGRRGHGPGAVRRGHRRDRRRPQPLHRVRRQPRRPTTVASRPRSSTASSCRTRTGARRLRGCPR